FPTVNPLQAAYGGGEGDAFVTKLNATGTALVYSTYLGGSSRHAYDGNDSGRGIAVDAAGAAYVTGYTDSADFTAGCTAPCTVLNATLNDGGSNPFASDAFVVKIAESTFHVARADFNGDGRADIRWTTSSTGENYLGPMNGTTTTAASLRTKLALNW